MPNIYTGAAGGAATLNVVKGGSGPNSGSKPTLDASHYTTRDIVVRLARYLAPHSAFALVALICSALTVVGQLVVPILIGRAIDACVSAGRVDFSALTRIAVQLAAAVVTAGIAQWIAGYATNRLCYQVVCDMRHDAYATFEHIPLSFADTHSHGDLLARVITDIDLVGEGLLQGANQLFTGIFTIVGTLAFMMSLSVPVALIVACATPISMLVAWLIARFSSKSFTQTQELQGELGGIAEEALTNQPLIAAFAHTDALSKAFSTTNRQLFSSGEHSQFISSLSNPSTRLVNNLLYATVAIIGCIGIITGTPSPLTAGQVQSFLSYANQFMKPFNDISAVVTQLQTALASARRALALIDAPQEPTPATAHALPRPYQGEISFHNVSFSYGQEEPPLLNNLSFTIAPGQTYALVGPTGCGKTTLINLLMRFYDPTSGTISVDGHPTRELTRESLRAAFGMVLQDTWLFTGTIAQNIAYGTPGATPAQIEAAARAAHAHTFITQLPKGYDTPITADGTTLSQGQCQLLCIARVILANPAILLLDEATSSIDTRTEIQVQEAFDTLMAGRTTLVVAHRLSTIQNADCILVLNNGTICERGTHAELLARHGFYAKLYESQFAPTTQSLLSIIQLPTRATTVCSQSSDSRLRLNSH